MVKGIIVNYRRGVSSQHPNQMIIEIPAVNSKARAQQYLGKKVEWTTTGGRKLTGLITAAHGNNGAVRARFDKPLPGQAIGTRIEVKAPANMTAKNPAGTKTTPKTSEKKPKKKPEALKKKAVKSEAKPSTQKPSAEAKKETESPAKPESKKTESKETPSPEKEEKPETKKASEKEPEEKTEAKKE